MSIGERIKAYRKEKGFTQKELAAAAQIATVTLQQYERGVRHPTLAITHKLAKALGVQIEDIIGLETFDSAVEFEQAWNAITSQPHTESLEVHYSVSPKGSVDAAMEKLNETGQKEAAKRVWELTEIPKYRK